MKVGTDGVLLGAWAGVRPSDRCMLDIGTGTGLIALMLAQRSPEASVTGVDIDDVSQARENADASPWGGRLAFQRCPVQEFAAPEPFDLIVSNAARRCAMPCTCLTTSCAMPCFVCWLLRAASP